MSPAELEDVLTRVVHPDDPDRRVLLPDELLDTPLDDLDVDSLSRAEMVAVLGDTYRIDISDEQAAALDTPRAVLEFVSARATPGGP
ncbi:phosphopantetheine-binding protein [Actinosynnema pretiosum]|uniref:Carrier domain-containing protein n=1 Tax=Actinosynnema pretiosum TaxID=42197 RepID=A0A290Z699_9PSEU|nr:phosphopantetheine-binding protein [Actinosynnema pretiosum]ATE54581.1 hypothetical protein CNX65_15835 [Actinosynnema pretiosum]